MAAEHITNFNGYLISVQAGATDVVTLEGLRFNGTRGVQFCTGGICTSSDVSSQTEFSRSGWDPVYAQQRQQVKRDRHGDQQHGFRHRRRHRDPPAIWRHRPGRS